MAKSIWFSFFLLFLDCGTTVQNSTETAPQVYNLSKETFSFSCKLFLYWYNPTSMYLQASGGYR